MCEYDYDWQEISQRTVRTRKPHECDCCWHKIPAGERAVVTVGKQDGDIARTYHCLACDFAFRQEDHTPLHFCWGHFWHDIEPGDREVLAHIRERIAKGMVLLPEHAVEIRHREWLRQIEEDEAA